MNWFKKGFLSIGEGLYSIGESISSLFIFSNTSQIRPYRYKYYNTKFHDGLKRNSLDFKTYSDGFKEDSKAMQSDWYHIYYYPEDQDEI